MDGPDIMREGEGICDEGLKRGREGDQVESENGWVGVGVEKGSFVQSRWLVIHWR